MMVARVGVVEAEDGRAREVGSDPTNALVLPADFYEIRAFLPAARVEVLAGIGVVEAVHVDGLERARGKQGLFDVLAFDADGVSCVFEVTLDRDDRGVFGLCIDRGGRFILLDSDGVRWR